MSNPRPLHVDGLGTLFLGEVWWGRHEDFMIEGEISFEKVTDDWDGDGIPDAWDHEVIKAEDHGLPPLPPLLDHKPKSCIQKCKAMSRIRKKNCNVLRKRVAMALKKAGCPSKVVATGKQNWHFASPGKSPIPVAVQEEDGDIEVSVTPNVNCNGLWSLIQEARVTRGLQRFIWHGALNRAVATLVQFNESEGWTGHTDGIYKDAATAHILRARDEGYISNDIVENIFPPELGNDRYYQFSYTEQDVMDSWLENTVTNGNLFKDGLYDAAVYCLNGSVALIIGRGGAPNPTP